MQSPPNPAPKASPLFAEIADHGAVTLYRVPELLRSRSGRAPHFVTVYRWARVGRHGVRLETVEIGGRMVTTRAAVERFVRATTAATLTLAG